MFNIELSPNVIVNIKGKVQNAQGVATPFEFMAHCKRKTVTELSAYNLEGKADEIQFRELARDILVGWSGVRSGESELSFSDEARDRVLDIPGVAGSIFLAYAAAVGVRAKN